jgi:hypothetical protein
MRIVAIEAVSYGEGGQLSVRPSLEAGEDMAFIWRAANGVRWDAAQRRLVHVPDSSPDPAAWFGRIISASRDEYGYQLAITQATRWIGVPTQARKAMESLALANK